MRSRRLQVQIRLSQHDGCNGLNNSFLSLERLKTEDGISVTAMLKTAECIITAFRCNKTHENIRVFRVDTRKIFGSILQNVSIGILHTTLEMKNNSPLDVFLQHVLGILGKGMCQNFSDGVRKVIRRSRGFRHSRSRRRCGIEETCGFLVSNKSFMVGTPILRLTGRPRSNWFFARFVVRRKVVCFPDTHEKSDRFFRI